MKERQRWRPEEDAVLRAYVRQYGPREWHLVSQRMNAALDRDAKSCLERWKNYLRPGIKKGSLTEEEQRLVIHLQAKHGNKWKRIAAEVPGRTAKRLGKWWEVFKEKQQRELRDARRPPPEPSPDERGRYEWLLENFAEKLVNERQQAVAPLMMAAPVIPPWLSSSSAGVITQPSPPSPSVTLSLASAAAAPPPPPPAAVAPWMPEAAAYGFAASPQAPPPTGGAPPPPHSGVVVEGQALAELVECCRELEEGQRAWAAHRREATWRLKRVEQQLEAEREARRREVWEDFEARMRAVRAEQAAAAERVEREYREKVAELRRDAQAKEEKMAEQWAAKHARVAKFLDQVGAGGAYQTPRPWSSSAEMN